MHVARPAELFELFNGIALFIENLQPVIPTVGNNETAQRVKR
jgi:hypothetical protein